MKIVNKAKEIEAFTTKEIDTIDLEKHGKNFHIKLTFDKGKGQLEIVMSKDAMKRLFAWYQLLKKGGDNMVFKFYKKPNNKNWKNVDMRLVLASREGYTFDDLEDEK